jgi:hypothetical protein
VTEWTDFAEWISVGIERGWCSEPVCATHDGIPRTEAEGLAWDDGWDPCENVVRLWPINDGSALGTGRDAQPVVEVESQPVVEG